MVLEWGEGLGLKEGELPDLRINFQSALECPQPAVTLRLKWGVYSRSSLSQFAEIANKP